MLEILGLGSTAESVYRTMLQRPTWRLQQIAEHLGISAAEVRKALDQLSELMLVAPEPGGASGRRALQPEVALQALVERADAEHAARRRQIDDARIAVGSIAAEYAAASRGGDGAVLDGVDAVRRRIGELTALTMRECISLNPNFTQTVDAKRESKPLNQQLLERGVTIRCVYQDSFRNDPRLVTYTKWFEALGGQTRTVPVVPLLMIVYDRSVALLPIDPDNTLAGAVEVRSAGVVAVAYNLFEQMWTQGTPFSVAAERDDVNLDTNQRQLLALLAAGFTDELVARRLGVSVTTVRRTMATLMNELGARSRFQAGVRARERGWLTPGAIPGPVAQPG